MGENPERVHMTGCPSIDIADEVLQNPGLGFDPLEKYGGVGAKLDLRCKNDGLCFFIRSLWRF